MARVFVADEVWIVTALLHREHPEREDFTGQEIIQRAGTECVSGEYPLRPGVEVHVYQHCVANKKPNPNRYCMLVETPYKHPKHRRLFKPGDPCHPERVNGKQIPIRNKIPDKYRELIDWYSNEYVSTQRD